MSSEDLIDCSAKRQTLSSSYPSLAPNNVPPFLPCHLLMLQSLYNNTDDASDSLTDSETNIDLVWARISMYLHHREHLRENKEQVKLLQDALVEANCREVSKSHRTDNIKQQSHIFDLTSHHSINLLNEVNSAASWTLVQKILQKKYAIAKQVASTRFAPLVELVTVVEQELDSLRTSLEEGMNRSSEQKNIISSPHMMSARLVFCGPNLSKSTEQEQQEQDLLGTICNKIYLWERLLENLKLTVNLSPEGPNEIEV